MTALQGPWVFITLLTTRHETNFTCVNLSIVAKALKISISKMLLIWRQDLVKKKKGRKKGENELIKSTQLLIRFRPKSVLSLPYFRSFMFLIKINSPKSS